MHKLYKTFKNDIDGIILEVFNPMHCDVYKVVVRYKWLVDAGRTRPLAALTASKQQQAGSTTQIVTFDVILSLIIITA